MSNSGITDVQQILDKMKNVEHKINDDGSSSLVGYLNTIIDNVGMLSEYCQSKILTDSLNTHYGGIINSCYNLYNLYQNELSLLSMMNDYVDRTIQIYNEDVENALAQSKEDAEHLRKYGFFGSNSSLKPVLQMDGQKFDPTLIDRYNQYGMKPIQVDDLKRLGATLGNTLVIAPTEGLGIFGENLVDGLVFCGAYFGSPTQTYGGKNLMELAREYIQEENTKDMFDDLYNTKFGNTIKENSLLFDVERNVGNKVGYAAPTVIMTLATKGGSLWVQMASTGAVTAVTSYGKNSEAAWRDGATTEAGAKYAYIKGTYDGVQSAGMTALGSVDPFTSGAGNTIFHLSTDAVAATENSLVTPALKTVYKDYYLDSDGNKVLYTDQDSFMEKWKTEYMNDDGIKGTLEGAGEGAGSDLAGQIIDGIIQYKK